MTQIAPPNPPMIAARWHGGSQAPKTIVIHGTVSPCVIGGARATAKYFARETKKTSAHYVVDPGEVIQCVGDHVVAYHCGHNQDSIGVELCDPQAGPGARWADKDHVSMLGLSAELVARLCLVYGIPIARISVADLKAGRHGICGHVDMSNAFHQSTHTDPGSAFPWATFIGLVQAAAKRIQGGTVSNTSSTSSATEPEYVTRLRNSWREDQSVDTKDLDLIIKSGASPDAETAKQIRDQLQADMPTLIGQLNPNKR